MILTAPVLRVTLESGAGYEDPSEDLLLILLQEIENGDGTFLIIDNLADSSGHSYGQTRRGADGTWAVEYRDGSPDRHYATSTGGVRTVHALLTGWAFQLPGWKEGATWAKLDL